MALTGVSLFQHLPELFRLCFQYVWQLLLQLRSAHLACLFELFVCLPWLLVFLAMLAFLLFVFPSCLLTDCAEPGRQVFCPSVRVFVVFGLNLFYYPRFYSFFYEEFLNPLCPCLIVIVEFIWDLIKFSCELVCGGVRLPGSCAVHIFLSVFPSYPLVSCLIVCRWFLMIVMCLMAWSGVPSSVIQRDMWCGGGWWVGLRVCILLVRRCMWCGV